MKFQVELSGKVQGFISFSVLLTKVVARSSEDTITWHFCDMETTIFKPFTAVLKLDYIHTY